MTYIVYLYIYIYIVCMFIIDIQDQSIDPTAKLDIRWRRNYYCKPHLHVIITIIQYDLYKRKYIAYIKCKITLQFAVDIKYSSPNINVDIIVFENCISYQAALRAVIKSFTSKHEDGKSEDQLTQSMCFPH